MRVVVTGGSGLVGRHIVRALARDHEAVNLDIREPADAAGEYVHCDILDESAVRRALDGAGAVIHAAALPGPSFGTEHEILRTNVEGTAAVMRATQAVGVRRFVQISSDAVLGFVFSEGRTRPRSFPIDETHPLSPVEPYGISKLKAELLLARDAGERLTVVALRPPWVWVPDEYDKYRQLTEAPDEWPDGLWAYVHGDDLARLAILAATRDVPAGFHAVFVPAPDNGTTVPTRELAGKHYPEIPVPAHVPEYGSLISSAGAARLLGSAPSMRWREFLV